MSVVAAGVVFFARMTPRAGRDAPALQPGVQK
jgi:hypothetical protein